MVYFSMAGELDRILKLSESVRLAAVYKDSDPTLSSEF